MSKEDQLRELIEKARAGGTPFVTAPIKQESLEWLLGSQGQIEAGRIIREITDRLRDLPETPVVGLFFGLVTAEQSGDSNEVGTNLEAEAWSTAWGIPSVVTNAVKDMLVAAFTKKQAMPS